ncbi:MAG: hypothetical protein KIT44_02390 [Opitutaceae bacterium]|nr:hypothetical protein [Opitutaceae bacterium]
MKPFVISINAVSGGGKTALAKLLAASLPKAVLFCFDDYDETNVYPADHHEWAQRGANLLEFDFPDMALAVENEIKDGAAKFVILDYPFGRDHPKFGKQIDLAVFIDTPLDVAMARRFLRETESGFPETAEEKLANLRSGMSHYVEKARHAYLATYRHKNSSDLILDGWTPLERLRDQILDKLNTG